MAADTEGGPAGGGGEAGAGDTAAGAPQDDRGVRGTAGATYHSTVDLTMQLSRPESWGSTASDGRPAVQYQY